MWATRASGGLMLWINWPPLPCFCVQHIAGLFALPPIHRDPFDRMLIAQAVAEGLALVTTDGGIARYASKSLRVVG